jgi:hypothetical protein
VDLGNVRSEASGGTGGGGSRDACSPSPCADHEGGKEFVVGDGAADASRMFATAVRHVTGSDTTKEPAIVYPSDETRFPINVARILHEWSSSFSDGLFELRFTGPRTQVRVYTTATRFTPNDEQWDWIAESNRGHDVTFEVAAVQMSLPNDVWTSRAITLSFSDSAVEGAIYYWSTGTAGVMKALVGEPNPVKFYTDPAATEKAVCVGCHTLSRDGTRLAVSYEGERLRQIAVGDRSVILPREATSGGAGGGAGAGAGGGPRPPAKADPVDPKADAGIPAAWTTFSPDGKLLLVAAGGGMTLIDADTGATSGPDAGRVAVPAGFVATHPDWSALGDRVAVTLAEKGGSKDVERGSIAILPFRDGAFGPAEILVQRGGGEDNNFFPVFSPDSRYIAYVNASEKSQDARSARLRLVRVDDGTITELGRLNDRVGALDDVVGIGNSMPSWAPATRPGLFWLAFSSVRAYASVRPADPKKDQIWIAGVDFSQPDPSFSAFWAPFQNLDHGNHRAFWTHSSEDRQCHCLEVCGDGVDNDCDGTADEGECQSSCSEREVCGDGIDNDCNCLIDDCSAEICGDGVDNDGDDLADERDPSCPAN